MRVAATLLIVLLVTPVAAILAVLAAAALTAGIPLWWERLVARLTAPPGIDAE